MTNEFNNFEFSNAEGDDFSSVGGGESGSRGCSLNECEELREIVQEDLFTWESKLVFFWCNVADVIFISMVIAGVSVVLGFSLAVVEGDEAANHVGGVADAGTRRVRVHNHFEEGLNEGVFENESLNASWAFRGVLVFNSNECINDFVHYVSDVLSLERVSGQELFLQKSQQSFS